MGGAPLWFDAALIGTFAAAGLALGLASLLVVHHVVEARAGRVLGWAVAVSSLVLSAIGIYLGRFPRFNSWDVVTDPHGLVAVVLQRLADPFGNPFLLRFGVMMSILLLGSYLVAWVLGRGILGPVRGRGASPAAEIPFRSAGVDDSRQPGIDVWALPMLMLGRVRVQPVGSVGLKLLIFGAPRASDRRHASPFMSWSPPAMLRSWPAATTLSRLDHDELKR